MAPFFYIHYAKQNAVHELRFILHSSRQESMNLFTVLWDLVLSMHSTPWKTPDHSALLIVFYYLLFLSSIDLYLKMYKLMNGKWTALE